MAAMRLFTSAVALTILMMMSVVEGGHLPGAAQTVNDFSFESQVNLTIPYILLGFNGSDPPACFACLL
jgi:hypothetical protein